MRILRGVINTLIPIIVTITTIKIIHTNTNNRNHDHYPLSDTLIEPMLSRKLQARNLMFECFSVFRV